MRPFLTWMLLLFVFTGMSAYGDTVVVNGSTKEGEVIEQTDSIVKMKIRGMIFSFSRDQVESITIDKPTEEVVEDGTPTPTATPILIKVYKSPTPVPPTPIPAASTTASGTPEDSGENSAGNSSGGKERFGAIAAIKGAVEVKREGQDWQKARVGMVIFFGDSIRTADGKVRILEKGRWDVRTLPGTIIRPFRDESGPGVDLGEGKVWSEVEPKTVIDKVTYRVRTPNAIAGVRGTLFAVEQKEKGESRVAVFEGAVDTASEGEVQTVRQNQAARYSVDKQFIGLSPAPASERDEWDFWDKWQAEVESIGRQFPIGGEVIGAMGAQIAAEQKLYEQMARDRNNQVMVNQVERAMQGIKDEILRYEKDMGSLPPPNEFWQSLQYRLTDNPNWKGPYGPPNTSLPASDRWGNKIEFMVGHTPGGKPVLQLHSLGPNGRSENGRGDDIIVFVRALPEAAPPEENAPGDETPQNPGDVPGN